MLSEMELFARPKVDILLCRCNLSLRSFSPDNVDSGALFTCFDKMLSEVNSHMFPISLQLGLHSVDACVVKTTSV